MAKINVQMYSFTEGWDKPYDNEKVFRQTAELGFDGVELFGPNLGMDPEELKALTSSLNLDIISMHSPNTDAVEGFIPFASALGLKFIGIGMELMKDDDAVHAFAKRLNELGAKCKEAGLTVTYHNHTQEFMPCGDKTVMQTLIDETDPECVAFELDAGWAAAAGIDPCEFIAANPGRIKLIHIKESDVVIGPQPPVDFAAIPKDENGAPIFTEEMIKKMDEEKKLNCPAGKGIVDWGKLQEVADANGCVGYSVEREYTPEPFATRYDVLKADLEFYRSVMK